MPCCQLIPVFDSTFGHPNYVRKTTHTHIHPPCVRQWLHTIQTVYFDSNPPCAHYCWLPRFFATASNKTSEFRVAEKRSKGRSNSGPKRPKFVLEDSEYSIGQLHAGHAKKGFVESAVPAFRWKCVVLLWRRSQTLESSCFCFKPRMLHSIANVESGVPIVFCCSWWSSWSILTELWQIRSDQITQDATGYSWGHFHMWRSHPKDQHVVIWNWYPGWVSCKSLSILSLDCCILWATARSS